MMSTFTKVLRNYCMIEDMESAERFVKKELSCSKVRKDKFLAECNAILVLKPQGHTAECRPCGLDEEHIKDYIDSLRRAPYQGMGI